MDINECLRAWGDAGGQCSQGIQNALDGDSTEAKKLWENIADGTADVAEALIWAHHVAQQIQQKVIRSAVSSERERGALRAIGYYGRTDEYRDAKQYMATFASFRALGENGEPLPRQRLTSGQWVRELKASGYLTDVNEKTALNRVNEWRKELDIE